MPDNGVVLPLSALTAPLLLLRPLFSKEKACIRPYTISEKFGHVNPYHRHIDGNNWGILEESKERKCSVG